MQSGTVVAIHLASTAGAPMDSVNDVEAVSGRGLKGDRYFGRASASPGRPEPGRQVTLVESEAIEQAARAAQLDYRSRDSRRNIVTRGVSLNDLIGREFRVGSVTLRGVELCEPCVHTVGGGGKEVLRSLVHHGGIRAEIVRDGTIHVGDMVEPQ